jgi:hypothetical protein
MEASWTYDVMVSYHSTSWHHNPEDFDLKPLNSSVTLQLNPQRCTMSTITMGSHYFGTIVNIVMEDKCPKSHAYYITEKKCIRLLKFNLRYRKYSYTSKKVRLECLTLTQLLKLTFTCTVEMWQMVKM